MIIILRTSHTLEFDDGRGWMPAIAGMHAESAKLARFGHIPEALTIAHQEHVKHYGEDPKYAARFRVVTNTITSLE